MQNLTWFPFVILSTLCFGFSMAFYKLPTTKNQSRYAVSFFQLSVGAILSVIFFYDFIPLTNIATILYGSLWGFSFLSLSLLQMKALKTLDTNTLYPITTSLSLVATVLFGILFFKDSISLLQIFGVILVILVVYLFSYKGKEIQYSKELIIIGLGIILLSAFGKIIQKFATGSVNIYTFQIYQYLSATLLSFVVYFFAHRNEFKEHLDFHCVKSGLLIGVPGFLGGYAWLTALSKGPFSLALSIHSLYPIITAIVAYFIFKEKLTFKKIFLIVLAIIAIIFIKIG